ncbi:Aminopeptidase [Trichostrongylus colubriformis]|uniref:Aminopeptidase n=1 Tax=Trichostrongylus colubriformis TaxID=6319 RepID=A0AAN8IBT4_TRICO
MAEVSVEEAEPCLKPESTKPPDSLISDLSSVSHRKPDYARRCILVLLIHAVFILAIFLAFLIGHWLSEQNVISNTTSNELIYVITSPPSTTNQPHQADDTVTLLTTSKSPALTHLTLTTLAPHARLIPLGPRRNFTLMDVVPPAYESYEFMEELHARQAKSKQDALLVPLPTHTLPLHYDLHLDMTKFDQKMIRGSLTVHLESFGNSTDDEILFHVGPRVNIERIRLRKEGKRVYPKTLRREDQKKLARIILKERLKRGRYLLEIEYNITICDQEGGVHCYYEMESGNTSAVASFTTKFEPAMARSFVPCWDDPGIKATFNISVLHGSKFVVLSNMPRSGEKRRRDGTTLTTFQETPPMSTYLLAFAIGEFVSLEMRTQRNLPLSVWTHPEDFHSARFPANFSPTMFDRLEDELEVPYPLPKMDFIAARSFPVGGMENWGLIVFDKQSLLLDMALEDSLNMTVDRLYHEYRIEKIVTHEITHQWFGNLVTMRDWSDLWLNEGFATYMTYDMLRRDHPKLTENEYLTRLCQLVRKQSTLDRPALVRPLTTEMEVEQSFHGTHLYSKGSVLTNMIRDLVSDFEFRAGVRRYLRKNAYRSVARQELWESMPAYADHGAEHERLSQVMEGWLVNEGIPELNIIRNYQSGMITLNQRQCDDNNHKVFLKDNEDVEDHEEGLSRYRRDDSHETLPFDDSLFDDPPMEIIAKPKKKRKHGRKKTTPEPKVTATPPSARIPIALRREELRKPRHTPKPSDIWSIPFSYIFGTLKSTEGQVVREFWLKNRSVSFVDVELSSSQPLLANPRWIYPFRVNYDTTNWKMIARLLHQNHLEIPERSRVQILIDAETFLAQSAMPQLFVYMLGYLANEQDLGVSLIGMNAIYRLFDSFRGIDIPELQLYLAPVVAQLDKLLDDSQTDTELAALWLIDPTRLSKLYQLRCMTNRPTCDHQTQARRWMVFPNSLHDDVHKQVTAVCHFLFTHNATREESLLEVQLKSRGAHWSTAVQLAACSHGDRIVKLAAKQIVATKNAAIFASSLQSDFSLHYNAKFRRALWTQIGKMTAEERSLLFSADEAEPRPASKILLHSVRTIEELSQVRSLVESWGQKMSKHLEYIERHLRWKLNVSQTSLREFFSNHATI